MKTAKSRSGVAVKMRASYRVTARKKEIAMGIFSISELQIMRATATCEAKDFDFALRLK